MAESGDPEIEAELDSWVEAKRSKQFHIADRLREELRLKGVDAERARPHIWKVADDVEPLLDRWVEAKRAKDFDTADRLREELRVKGVDAERARPHITPEWQIETMLDRWVELKRAKDFQSADALREELRVKGVDAEAARPSLSVQQQYEAQQVVLSPYMQQQQKQQQQRPQQQPQVQQQQQIWQQPRWQQQEWQQRPQQWQQRSQWQQQQPRWQQEWHQPQTPHVTTVLAHRARYSADIERELDDWVSAKRLKDFATADRLREDLRLKGVDAEVARPPLSAAPNTEALLDQWVEAKRSKDFVTADKLREQLYGMGVDAESARPPLVQQHRSAPHVVTVVAPAAAAKRPGGAVSYGFQQPQYPAIQPPAKRARNTPPSYDAATEAQLDRWVEAKRASDFATADRIRSELHAKGVYPDVVRPPLVRY